MGNFQIHILKSNFGCVLPKDILSKGPKTTAGRGVQRPPRALEGFKIAEYGF